MNQKGFGIVQVVLLVLGILILFFAIWVGSLFIRYQQLSNLQDEKDKEYQQYRQTLESATPSATPQY